MINTKKEELLTAERARELLYYNAETGEMRWKISSGRASLGKIAGAVDNKRGYIRLCVDGKRFLAHRVAWLMAHGEFPECDIDHINRVPSDNRLSNLRKATKSQNQANRGLDRDSMSGVKGVHWHKVRKKWIATIRKDGSQIHLGCFDNVRSAGMAYQCATVELNGEYALKTDRLA